MRFNLKTLLLLVLVLPPLCGLMSHCWQHIESFQIGYHVGYLPDIEYKYYYWDKGNILALDYKKIPDNNNKIIKYYYVGYPCGTSVPRSYASRLDYPGAFFARRALLLPELNRKAMYIGNLAFFVQAPLMVVAIILIVIGMGGYR